MLRKTKEQNSIGFLENTIEEIQIKAKIDETKSLEKLAKEQKSKKYDGKDNGTTLRHSILSCKSADETEIKGSSKYIKSETSNSIWGNGKFKESKIVKEDKIGDAISEQNKLEEKRQEDKKRMESIPVAASEGMITESNIQRKKSLKSPSNCISMFDKKGFERLDEKTNGEKLSEDIKKKNAEKDESWKKNGKAMSSNDMLSHLFENLKIVKG